MGGMPYVAGEDERFECWYHTYAGQNARNVEDWFEDNRKNIRSFWVGHNDSGTVIYIVYRLKEEDDTGL